MLKALIRKSDNVVLWRQDSPNHRPGTMAQAAARQYDGSPDDYMEIIVDNSEKERVFAAKELKWDTYKQQLKIKDYLPAEIEERERATRKKAVEHDMVTTQMEIDACMKLELDTTERQIRLSKLKAQHQEIKLKEKELKDKKNG